MNKLVLMAVLMVMLSLNASAKVVSEQTKQRIEETLPGKLEGLYNKFELKGDFLLAVVDAEGLKYSYTLNTKGNDSIKNGLNIDTPFLIASHTKAFTGTLANVLASEGDLVLNAPIEMYLKDDVTHPSIPIDQITVKQLLNHTAGFTSIMHTFKTAFLGFENNSELVKALNTNTMVAPVGSFRYSNTGPILAARAMENATKKSWKTLMQEKLFQPLGMHNTHSSFSTFPADAVLPSIEIGANGEVLREGLFKSDNTLHAAGGNISTLADMAKWMQFNLARGQELSNDTNFFRLLHEPTTVQDKTYYTYKRTGYSLAWDIATYQDHTILTRFGSYAGVSFHASFMPEEGIAVIAVFNDHRGYVLPHLAANLAYNLAIEPDLAYSRYDHEVKGLEKSIEREQANALNVLDRVEYSPTWAQKLGNYVNVDGWPPITLSVSDNQVWLSTGELEGPVYLNREKEGSYIVNLGSIRRTITFTSSEDGQLTLKNGSLQYSKAT